jgi:hypothetical protein
MEASRVQAHLRAAWSFCLFVFQGTPSTWECEWSGRQWQPRVNASFLVGGLLTAAGSPRKWVLKAGPKSGPLSRVGPIKRLLLCGGRELGIRQGGSGEYRRPPNARGHSAKPTDRTSFLHSTPPPCKPNRRSSKQILAEDGLASQPLAYLLLGNDLRQHCPAPFRSPGESREPQS